MFNSWGKSVSSLRTTCSMPMDTSNYPVYSFGLVAHEHVNNRALSPVMDSFYSRSFPQNFSLNQSVKFQFSMVSTIPTISTANLNLLER